MSNNDDFSYNKLSDAFPPGDTTYPQDFLSETH